jgi:hypothetical protein
MLFVVSKEGKDSLVNLENGSITLICKVRNGGEDHQVLSCISVEGHRRDLGADDETLSRFRELVRKTKEEA